MDSESTNMDMSSVLAAVRGEQCDDNVVQLACDLLKSHKHKLYILYVIEVDRRLPIDAEIASDTSKAEEVLDRLEGIARASKFKTEGEMVQSREFGSAVVQEAFDKKVDAIVVGTPRGNLYGSYNLGNTVPYVLENAPCQVIVWQDHTSRDATDRSK